MAANTLTGLIPVINEAYDIVSRELTGLTNSVYKNASAEMASVGQTVRYPVSPEAGTPSDNTPAAYAADATGITTGYDDIVINNSKYLAIPYNGEEQNSVSRNKGGVGWEVIMRDNIAQAMRKHVNTIEAYIGTTAYKSACRAVGSAGTTPFASTTDVAVDALKILLDNGAPNMDLKMCIDTAAGAKMRKLTGLQKQNEVGGNLIRNGVFDPLFGFSVEESAGIAYHTAGTGSTSYAVNNVSGYAVGSQTIALDTGSGTILAGDCFSNTQSGVDSEVYVVKTALSGGNIVLNKNGIRSAWANDNTTAVGASYRANLAFNKNAIHLVTRAPFLPEGGDAAADEYTISDPKTGLVFQVLLYKQFRQNVIHIAIAYDVKVVKSEHLVIIRG